MGWWRVGRETKWETENTQSCLTPSQIRTLTLKNNEIKRELVRKRTIQAAGAESVGKKGETVHKRLRKLRGASNQ